MREKLAKSKTAGFDHQGAFLSRKAITPARTNSPTPAKEMIEDWSINDKNKIKIPENVAFKVLRDGSVNYRPKNGD